MNKLAKISLCVVAGAGALLAAAPSASAGVQSGAGTSIAPFTAPCDTAAVDCTVTFDARTLKGSQSEQVPAYLCPDSNPYLVNQDFNPWGVLVPSGVQVNGFPSVGINISKPMVIAEKSSDGRTTYGYHAGTDTGEMASSVTNWDLGQRNYQIVLHCTSDTSKAHQFVMSVERDGRQR